MASSTIVGTRVRFADIFRLLKANGISIVSVDKHVLKDFIHYRRTTEERAVRVEQKTIENDFSAFSLSYDYLQFED